MHKALVSTHVQPSRSRVADPLAASLRARHEASVRAALNAALSGGRPGVHVPDLSGIEHHWQQFSGGAVLFEAGSADDKMWLLLNGQVAIGKHDNAGRWWQSRTVAQGDWVDLTSAWAGGTHLETALALGPVQVVTVSLDAVTALLESEPGVAKVLLRRMARLAGELTLQRQALLTHDIQARVAAWVLEQSGRWAALEEWPMQQKKKALASQLGATPETLSRCLRNLHEQGLIALRGYQLRVLDPQALRKLAEPSVPLQPLNP